MTCLLLAQDTQVKIVCVSDLLVIIVQRFVLWGICQQLDHMHPYASVCCNSPRAADDMIPRLPQLLEKFLWSQWASMAEAARLAVHDSLQVHDVLMQKVHRVVSTRHGCVS